jgi:hypothetical protein
VRLNVFEQSAAPAHPAGSPREFGQKKKMVSLSPERK